MSRQGSHHQEKGYQKQSESNRFRYWCIWAGLLLFPLTLAGIIGIGAVRFENKDSSCAACHTQPESTYFQRESVSTPTDLASFHTGEGARCIDCHSNQGAAGRVAAMMLGARDLMSFITGRYSQPAPMTHRIDDGNCVKCHASVSQKRDFNNHFHVFLPQWQMQDPNAAMCVDCHQGHSTSGSVAIEFLNQATTQSVCQTCHAFVGSRG